MEASNTSKLIKGMSSQTIITIIMGGLSILTFSIFSRLLSKEDFGYYAALGSILIIFQSFADAGLGSAVIQIKNCSKQYLSTAFTLSLAISSVIALLLFLTADFWANLVSDETIATPLRFFSLLLILEGIQSIGGSIMVRNLEFLKYGWFQIVAYVIGYGIGIAAAYYGYGLFSLVLASLLHCFILVVLIFLFSVKIPQLLINKKDSKMILNFGGWLTASVLVNQITQQLDRLVLSKWLSVVALGAYSRPSSFISQITERINGIFDTALFPILSSIQDDEERIKKTFLKAVSVLNSFSSTLAILFFFNTPLIIQIFFGEEWMDLIPVFHIISLGVVLAVDQRLVDCYFRSLALVKQNFWLRFICMFIVLGGLFVGVHYGILGTAICIVIANVIIILLKVAYLCVKIKVSFSNFVGKFIVSLKPTILLIMLGLVYIKFGISDSLIFNLLTALVFGMILILEYILFPQLVSEEYTEISKPYLQKVYSFVRSKI